MRAMPLDELAARPGYADRIAAVTARIKAAASPMEALGLLQAAADEMGVGAAAFVSFVRDDDSHESYRFLLACELAWCAEYEARAWYADDPWLDYARSSTVPVRARDIAARGALQRDIVALARRYGFTDALIVPAPSSANITRTGVLCLGSSQADFFEGEGFMSLRLQARALAMELHEWWIAHVGRELMQQARLSDSDLALLRLERQGQCTKLIADALDTTVHAVNSRFQRMTERLGVPNRKAAANLAAEYGLI